MHSTSLSNNLHKQEPESEYNLPQKLLVGHLRILHTEEIVTSISRHVLKLHKMKHNKFMETAFSLYNYKGFIHSLPILHTMYTKVGVPGM